MFSTKVTRQIAKGLKKLLKSNRKDGWSPTFVAYKANLDALLEIRRHYLGQHGCKKWKTSLDILTRIIKKVSQWYEIVKGFALEPAAKELALSITTHSPEYWRTIEATDPTILVTLELDMTKLQSEMHGRKKMGSKQGNGKSW